MRSHVPATQPGSCKPPLLQCKADLQLGESDDAYEREADRAADAIINGASPNILSRVSILPPLQREEKPAAPTNEEKYKEAAKKVGEAFLETAPGKEIKQKAEDLGDAFIATLPGKIIAGTAISGAVATLAATHSELPIGIPEIPLDKITPGLKLNLTYEGPVDSPTRVMAGFTIPLGPNVTSDKPAPGKSGQIRSEAARLAREQYQFREMTKTPQQRAADREAEQAVINAWVARTALGAEAGGPPSAGKLPPPLAPYAAEFKLSGEQPKTQQENTKEPKKKKEQPSVQRKANGPQPGSGVPASVHKVLASAGRPLDTDTRTFMESRFGYDFSRVRIHTDEYAAQSARAINALAYTSGNHLAFGAGQYAPDTSRGLRTLSHELAHVVQQQGAAPGKHPANDMVRPAPGRAGTLMRRPDSLAAIPASEQRAIQVSTMAVSVPASQIKEFFTIMPSGKPSASFSVGDKISYAANIDPALRDGLASTGAWIAGQTNALPVNKSIEIALDLSSYGGSHSTFRFTRFEHSTGTGAKATTEKVMLIELLGNVVAAPAGQAAPTGAFTLGAHSFKLAGNWSDDEYALLRQGLSLLPATALSDAAGVTFSKSGHTGSGSEAGEYRSETDTIVLHDNAFSSSSMRVGQHTRTTHNILHEIGHALDLRVLERAWTAFDSAGQSKSARATLLATRSPSGARYVHDAGSGDFNVEQALDDSDGAFRKAAGKDKVARDTSGRTTVEGSTANLSGGVTSYSDTDYEELFAESFALYSSAPETLRQLRPNIYNYFSSKYPRPASP